MRGVGIQQAVLALVRDEAEPRVAGGLAAHEGADEEDLSQFGAVVEVGRADVGVYFGERGEGYGGGGGAVQVGGLPDQAGVGGCEEVGEEGEG